jgi:isoleucyl-tRNA synthetase
MPFLAETIYQKIKHTNDAESVHLCDWPHMSKADTDVLLVMQTTRNIVSELLELRAQYGIKVRQPLASATIPASLNIPPLYTTIIADEVNVKEIKVSTDSAVSLDTQLSPILIVEGTARDVIREIQDLRKKQGMQATDKAEATVIINEQIKNFFTDSYYHTICAICGLSSLDIKSGNTDSYEGITVTKI